MTVHQSCNLGPAAQTVATVGDVTAGSLKAW